MKQIDWWFYVFLSWVSTAFFGEQKTRYTYRAMVENYFAGHYLLILPFLALCLSKQSTALWKTSGLEVSNWLGIWPLNDVWVSFYFHQRVEISLKRPSMFELFFLHEFLICLLNVDFRSIVIPRITSSSLFF